MIPRKSAASIVRNAASVVPPFGRHFRSQACEVPVTGIREQSGTVERCDSQAARGLRFEAELGGRLRHQLGEQEEISGTAARQCRHDVDRLLGGHPNNFTNRQHDPFGGRAMGAPTCAGAYSPVTPAPTSAGLLGIARTTGIPGPHQLRAWRRGCPPRPITLSDDCASVAVAGKPARAASCGFTARTMSSAFSTAATLSAVAVIPKSRASARARRLDALTDRDLFRTSSPAQKTADECPSHVATAEECQLHDTYP